MSDIESEALYAAEFCASKAKVGIIIPIFKHPVFVVEAIDAALKQLESINGGIVIVNDGCPYDETHRICRHFSITHREVIEYIRTPNKGLSAARNRGIRQAFRRWKSLDYIYLLDADNRIRRGGLRRAVSFIETTDADWLYPNIDKFGIDWNGDFMPVYSKLRHLFQNICEAGSLIHRRVFECGVWFDEDMKKGYEDWDFWLQCIEKGFKGACFDNFGFEYRARRESMVRDANRLDSEIIAYIQNKHKVLYSWKNIIRLEHYDSPRYCFVDYAGQSISLFSVPGKPSRTERITKFTQMFWNNVHDSVYCHFPHFIIFGTQSILDDLKHNKLLDWIFWQIEDALEIAPLVLLDLAHSTSFIEISLKLGNTSPNPYLVATTSKTIIEYVEKSPASWADIFEATTPNPNALTLRVVAPFLFKFVSTAQCGLDLFFQGLNDLRVSPARAQQNWIWRKEGVVPKAELFRHVRGHMKAFAPLGGFALENDKEIAFLLPIMSFGGVEQVCIQIAAEFKRRGWRTRLIVTQAKRIDEPLRLYASFDTILFLNDALNVEWQPSGLLYYGQDLQRWASDPRQDRLIGLVAGCGAVMNLQTLHGNEIMGWLKCQGVITINSLHLIDRDCFMAPSGHPYMMLAYEHVYDIIVAPSQYLLEFCHASGVPDEKLIHLPNVATFGVNESLRQRRIDQTKKDMENDAPRPLRVLSLGRLDRQKGLDRLIAAVEAARDIEVSVEWRLVGSQVIPEANSSFALSELMEVDIASAVYSREEVIEHLLWADLVIILSYWEGSPLTILEAQSLGAIPLVTNVGAIREMIDDGRTGIILKETNEICLINETTEWLRRLVVPSHRAPLVQSMVAKSELRESWRNSCDTLIKACDRLLINES